MEKRNVLVLDRQGVLIDELLRFSSADRVFHFAQSIVSAKQLLLHKPCRVGLVVFEEAPAALSPADIEPLLAAAPASEWIAVATARSMSSPGIQSFVLSAFHDYHTLPVDPQRLLPAIGHAWGRACLRLALRDKGGEAERFGIYGASPVMQAFFQQLEKVVKADVPVLVGGESGTGKELVAQAIHAHSERAAGPFVAVNCGAIAANLIQSELFGHEKGAFTGAVQRKAGSVEAANGGVLFLDEIADLPLELQANLLRVLQERQIIRLGSTQPLAVDFRLVAATHVDLREAIVAGRFREDLYYRLNVVHLQLPPLRERGGDVQLLAEAVLRKFALASRSRVRGFSSEALRALSAYPWPGNVRELINRVHRAVVMSENPLLGAADLGLETYVPDRAPPTLEDARASFERNVIESSLRANGNNVTQTARQLGVSRVTLYRILNRPLAG